MLGLGNGSKHSKHGAKLFELPSETLHFGQSRHSSFPFLHKVRKTQNGWNNRKEENHLNVPFPPTILFLLYLLSLGRLG